MSSIPPFVGEALGGEPRDPALFERALTHGSHGRDTYERLEFLGDRVLGLVIASWLYQRYPNEPEGKMSQRYNALVARETCAEIGRLLFSIGAKELQQELRKAQAAVASAAAETRAAETERINTKMLLDRRVVMSWTAASRSSSTMASMSAKYR